MNILNDGYTLMNEHMTLDLSRIKQEEDCRLDCKEETIREWLSSCMSWECVILWM